jgi:hypothetical protein
MGQHGVQKDLESLIISPVACSRLSGSCDYDLEEVPTNAIPPGTFERQAGRLLDLLESA